MNYQMRRGGGLKWSTERGFVSERTKSLCWFILTANFDKILTLNDEKNTKLPVEVPLEEGYSPLRKFSTVFVSPITVVSVAERRLVWMRKMRAFSFCTAG